MNKNKSLYLKRILIYSVTSMLFIGQTLAENSYKEFNHQHPAGVTVNEFEVYHNEQITNGISNNLNLNTLAIPSNATINIDINSTTVGSNKWMSKLDDAVKLKDLNIPGTHDSLSYRNNYDNALYNSDEGFSWPNNLYKHAPSYQTQSANLRNQLDSGIRYLDLRIGNKDGFMTARHGNRDMLTRFDVMLKTMATFLSLNPNETLFVRLKKESYSDHTDNTFAFILESYIRGQRFIRKRKDSGSSGWNDCLTRNDNHAWCRATGYGTNVDKTSKNSEDENDTYHENFSHYFYKGSGDSQSDVLTDSEVQNLTLADVRGKIVILKDFTNDENSFNPWIGSAKWGDHNDCSGGDGGANHCTKFAVIKYGSTAFKIQDKYALDDTSNTREKLNYVKDHLIEANNRRGSQIYMNYLSATDCFNSRGGARCEGEDNAGSYYDPSNYAKEVNPFTYSQLPNYSYVGFIVMDFPGQDLIKRVIQKNFPTISSVGDFNGDGLEDVAEFTTDGPYIRLSTGKDSFTSTTPWLSGEFTKGWKIDKHPRMMADANGDGKDDVVGFSNDNIFVALSTGSSFARKTEWLRGDFGYNSGWKVDKHPRIMADVNGDDKDDVVGFSNNIIFVALSTGSGFAPKTGWLSGDLTYNSGWKVDKHPRIMADFNGDGKDDIVAFRDDSIFVALSEGNGFAIPQKWLSQ
jgi:hypothetical protein